MFPNEHPSHVARRLEVRMTRLKRLQEQIAEIDTDDGVALRKALLDTVGEMRELTKDTGILAGRMTRDR